MLGRKREDLASKAVLGRGREEDRFRTMAIWNGLIWFVCTT